MDIFISLSLENDSFNLFLIMEYFYPIPDSFVYKFIYTWQCDKFLLGIYPARYQQGILFKLCYMIIFL